MTSFWSWGSSMRTDRALLLVPLLAAVVGCDRNGRDLVQRPDADNPAVLQIGELAVVDVQPDWLDGNGDIGALYVDPSFCAGQDGEQRCYFGSVGTPEPGVRGGATFTFKGTGDVVTILMDAETVYWNTSISPIAPNESYVYPDNIRDDGDMDLFAGLSTYYTGSPGVTVGDFKGYYTDSLGSTVEIEYTECQQSGSNDNDDAHSGRGAAELCTVDTSKHPGVDYTVVLETFSTPLNDGVLSFAAMVISTPEGESGSGDPIYDINPSECNLVGEALDKSSGETLPGTLDLERVFCSTTLGDEETLLDLRHYCCDNPELCGDEPPVTACDFSALDTGE